MGNDVPLALSPGMSHTRPPKLTLLDTVFLGALVVWVLVLLGDALGTRLVVELCGTTLGGHGAVCRQWIVSLGLFIRFEKPCGEPIEWKAIARSLNGDWSSCLPLLPRKRNSDVVAQE